MTQPNTHNRTLGAQGEDLAAEYLEGHGFIVIDRNWRNRYGEIDLVVIDPAPHDGPRLIAVEVKTRSGRGFGDPLESITVRKTERLGRLLLDWRRAHPGVVGRPRVDAIGITMRADASPEITHLRGIQ